METLSSASGIAGSLDARLRELVENAQEIIYEVGLDGRVAYHNAAAQRVLGIDRGLVGVHFTEIVAPEHRDRVRRFYLRQFAGKIPNTYTEFAATLGDREVWLGQNVQLSCVDGRPVAFHAVARDLAESRRLYEQLRTSEERFRRFFDDAPIGMAIVALDGQFVRVNRVLCELLGYTEDELLDLDFQKITHPDDLEEDLERARRLMSGEARSYSIEKRYVHKNGVAVWAQLNGTAVRDGDDRPLYFIAQIIDYTERNRFVRELAAARDAALETSRMKSDFMANMSHEIRTPMNGIIGVTGLMLTTDLSEEQRAYTRIVQSSAESLMRIVNDILDFSTIESGNLKFESIELDVTDIVHGVRTLFGHGAAAKGLDLEILVGPGISGGLKADPDRIRQVLTNLVSNAIKFTDQGKISVSARVDNRYTEHPVARFEVSDTGIGIAETNLPRLFDTFVQVDSSTSRRYGGAGLGLAISRQLVQMMGGTIGVISTVGEGSTFWFTIPLNRGTTSQTVRPHEPEPSSVSQKVLAPAEDPKHDGGLRILLAEDNLVNQTVTLGQLRLLGYSADVVTNGWQVLEMLAHHRYDVILMDCMMPEMDGYRVTEILRAHERPDEHHVIIALTASAVAGSREQCIGAGMDDYISKPIGLEDLSTRLATARDVAYRARTRKLAMRSLAIDPEVLATSGLLTTESSAYLEDALTSFLADAYHRLSELERSLEAGAVGAIGSLAHALLGSSRQIGASRLARIVEELTDNECLGHREMCHFLLSRIRNELGQIAPEIEALLAR